MTDKEQMELDEIVQNIRDDAIAGSKGWQGSDYDGVAELYSWHSRAVVERVKDELWGVRHEITNHYYDTSVGRKIDEFIEQRLEALSPDKGDV